MEVWCSVTRGALAQGILGELDADAATLVAGQDDSLKSDRQAVRQAGKGVCRAMVEMVFGHK